MLIAATRFNIYLTLLLALIGLGTGCQTVKTEIKKEPTSGLQFHLEVNPDGTDKNGPVTINRATPFQVNIERHPFLTEYQIAKAAVVDDALGGFRMFVQFNRQGTWLLEQYTTAHKGKRIAIFSHFTGTEENAKREGRWLAAPVITRRVREGDFTFTPDARREEAETIATGLNNLAKKEQKHNP